MTSDVASVQRTGRMQVNLNQIRAEHKAGATIKELSQRYQVGFGTIHFWLHCPAPYLPVPLLPLPRIDELRGRALGLTGLDVRLLAYISAGYENRQIAAKLGTTTGKITGHLKVLYPRIGAPDRASAVRRAYELRLFVDA